MPSNVKKSVSLTFLTSVASKNGKFLKNCNPNILPPSVLAKTCISAFNAHNLGFLSLMDCGQVKNKILHYAGPNSEFDRSPQAPANAQKCRFLTWTWKNTFFGIYQPGAPKKLDMPRKWDRKCFRCVRNSQNRSDHVRLGKLVYRPT